MVSMPTNTTTFTPASCPIPMHSCDTTPPPDEPDFMEVTTAELVPMETTATELGNIVTIFSKETNLDSSHLQGVNRISVADITALVPNSDQEVFSDGVDDTSETSDDSQTESLLEKPLRSKRRSSTNVSYAMPSLRSKLRRGDPFTDPFFQGTFCLTKSKRKGSRMSTGCIQKKPRHALTNLTNIITEEQEA
ncbi:shugoshin 1-like [Actinia tenebrosa]|uniref:Shugoshin 1-like n=1 Tax=Actinia tenebrosa TaxID=6105 RepID=A0A6P8IBV7_ACTTE|nr:shugoshin 1-like [Actinia tenebrosa]